VQDPDDAEFPSMPLNVLEYVDVDHVVPISDMGPLLHKLTQETATQSTTLTKEELERLHTEVNIAAQDNSFEMGILNKGALTPLTCPECHGALVQFTEGKIIRYRCHTGHGFTDSALLAGVTKSVEESLWQTVKSLEEAIMILEQTARQFENEGNQTTAKLFYRKARETHHTTKQIREIIFEQERFSEDLRFTDNGKEARG
jgi:two-component system chemotaxis response regulator CheB